MTESVHACFFCYNYMLQVNCNSIVEYIRVFILHLIMHIILVYNKGYTSADLGFLEEVARPLIYISPLKPSSL